MEDPSSDDLLPPGWTVEVKVRKNGKRDKYYFSPESGLKFNSKVEVFRHLDNAQKKVSIQRVADNVVVEKGVAEGLPAGWMKKTRVTTKGDTVRRDSYYIDPVSGYAFRSLKDVDRYLESGEIGRNAFKPKDSSDMEFKVDKFSSIGETTKPSLSVGMCQSSDLDMIASSQLVQKPACSGEYVSMAISENISTQCVVGTELTTSVPSEAESSDRKEVKVGLAESTSVPGCTDEESQRKLPENEQPKHETEKAQDRQRKRHKKEINLPRRSSKRLAGIQVDPVPELITRSRARRAAAKQSGEGETIQSEDNCSNSLPHGAGKQINALEGGSEIKCKSDCATNIEEHGSDKVQECFSFWPQENCGPMEEHVRVLENGDKVDAKLDYSLEFPLRELLTDPCIAFAVQTLTGVTFATSKPSQVSAELKNSEHSETLAAAEGHGKIKGSNMGDDKGRCNVFSHPENFPIPPQQHAGDAGIAIEADENTGSSSEKALDISWMDPCIEFAIKTLTGTIPLDSDQNPKNCIQQQLSSSNTHHGEMALSSVSLDNICQTDYYRSQNFGSQKPMFKQSFVDPTPQHTRNAGIGNSAGARVPHCGDDRRNVC